MLAQDSSHRRNTPLPYSCPMPGKERWAVSASTEKAGLEILERVHHPYALAKIHGDFENPQEYARFE